MAGTKQKNFRLFIILCFVGIISTTKSFSRVKSFHCINGNYVYNSWFCDGVNDCGDSSDEFYGCDSAYCGSGNFTCNDKKCLPIPVRCNGIPDCADGSDEEFCDHEPELVDCNISQGQFLCKDKFRCIDLNYVCDGELHCFDGSDETSGCNDYDASLCNSCYHTCFRTPDGPYCFFNRSLGMFEEAYKDILGCEPSKNSCDQKCISYKDYTQCSCEENFSYNYTYFNSLMCVEKEKDKNMLVYVTSKGIKAIRGYKNESITIMNYSDNITAISAANESIYWGGIYDGYPVIGKISLQGKIQILFAEDIGDITAMDVDWRTGNVYYIDNIRKRLAACTENGPRCIEVHKITHSATSLSLAPRYGYLFWSEFDEEDGLTIRKSEMNGEIALFLVSDGLRDVTTISADETSEKLYWLDAIRRRIEMIQFDGSGRKIFKADLRSNYLSLTINAHLIYWILVNHGSIFYSSNKRTNVQLALADPDPIRLIYGYSHSEKTTQLTPPCNWGCNGICLLKSNYQNKTGSFCVCTNKTAMVNDGKWCSESCDTIFGYSYHDEDSIDNHELLVHVESPHFLNTSIIVFFFLAIMITIGVGIYTQRHRLPLNSYFNTIRHSRL